MKSEDRQQQILNCAKKVFADHGYHGTNISHICEAAGIARGTLYQYFENKKRVFMAILEGVLERIEANMQSQLPNVFPPPNQLSMAMIIEWNTSRLRQALGVVFADRSTMQILLREAVGLDPEVEELMEKIEDRLVSMVEHDLEAAKAAGFCRDLNPRVTAVLMVGGAEKLAFELLRKKKAVDIEFLAREVSMFQLFGVLSQRVLQETTDNRVSGDKN